MAPDLKAICFASREQMAARVGDLIEAALTAAIGKRGHATICVSGGSTPADLYRDLSLRAVDWRNVSALLVDERWVAPADASSNERFVKETLQQDRAADVSVIGLWSDAPSPADGLVEAQRRLAPVGDALDVVVLGMGNDGHTASWFPHSGGLGAALNKDGPLLSAITAQKSDVTGDNLERMTMTLAAVAGARRIVLLLAGDAKRATFETALEPGPVEDMPVRAILRARPDMWVCWAP